MSNAYTPGTPGMPSGMGMPPMDLAKKAGNIQLMGILSIVFAFCCGLVSIVLSILVLTQAGNVTAALQAAGSPPDLMGKVSTGRTCAIVGLIIAGVMMVCGVGSQVVIRMNK